ncbi:hypothetical protein ABIA16_001209 [Sinorhizobium fredii]
MRPPRLGAFRTTHYAIFLAQNANNPCTGLVKSGSTRPTCAADGDTWKDRIGVRADLRRR